MSRYEITTLDVCVQGFERLRNQDEFLLLAYVDGATSADDFLSQWLSDIQACSRPDGFDYDAVKAAVKDYWASTAYALRWPNPFHLDAHRTDLGMTDEADDEDEDGEGCTAFLYVRDNLADGAEEAYRVESGDFDASPDADRDPARPWVVTLDPHNLEPGDRLTIVGRFSTQEIAEAFVGYHASIDPTHREEGHYGIDGPSGEEDDAAQPFAQGEPAAPITSAAKAS